jgi:hypothetical protein
MATDPFGKHNGYLAALDRMYFSRWAIDVERLVSLRGPSGGLASAEAEMQLQTEVFQGWRPTVVNHLVHLLRVAKLMMRQRLAAGRTEAT